MGRGKFDTNGRRPGDHLSQEKRFGDSIVLALKKEKRKGHEPRSIALEAGKGKETESHHVPGEHGPASPLYSASETNFRLLQECQRTNVCGFKIPSLLPQL